MAPSYAFLCRNLLYTAQFFSDSTDFGAAGPPFVASIHLHPKPHLELTCIPRLVGTHVGVKVFWSRKLWHTKLDSDELE